MAKENFISGEEEINWNQNPHVRPISNIRLKPKSPDLSNLSDYKNVHPFLKTLSKKTRETFPSRRKVKIFFEKLGKSYKRLNNLKHSQGLFYRLCGDSLPTKNTNKGKIKPSSGRICITGSERNAGEGYHERDNSLQGPVCQPSVPSIKEGWRATTSDQPEGFEHIHTSQTLQEGRTPSVKGNFETRRLSIQVGPQRRLFLCSIEQTV